VPVDVGGVTVSPVRLSGGSGCDGGADVVCLQGDIILCDPLEGVVAIPQELLDQVLELMPKLVAMDDKVKDAVSQGMNVFDAFKQFRTKI
jgi:regulator of RNase E activity RraA